VSTRTTNMARAVLVLGAMVIPSHSVIAQTVNVDFDHQADFSRCTSYSWIMGQPARNAWVDNLIVSQIDDALAAHGLRKVTSDPTCLVMYQASVTEQKPAQVMGGTFGVSWGIAAASPVRVTRVLEGMLIVDIGYADNQQIIWRGVASDTVGDSDEKNKTKLTSIVQTMFKDFPPSTVPKH
jgi:hypothetical protein